MLFADGHPGARARPATAQRFMERDECEGRVAFTLGERTEIRLCASLYMSIMAIWKRLQFQS
jgi:hypothetical protein